MKPLVILLSNASEVLLVFLFLCDLIHFWSEYSGAGQDNSGWFCFITALCCGPNGTAKSVALLSIGMHF